ncbi:unnamed protein product [Ilex paraguariensis]|uniref:RING-type domain-containing protein n=1 Tax=Ilex paraguariensis TaxID=185542 RepID=A0ABC8RYV2_9AQUA
MSAINFHSIIVNELINLDVFTFLSQQNYTVLSEADIRHCQEENIIKVSAVLSISKVAAGILLRHYNWNVSKVNDEWFSDEEKVRMAVGLLEKPVPFLNAKEKPVPFLNAKELTCGICFETFPCDRMNAAACGHPFCVTCWQGWMDILLKRAPSAHGHLDLWKSNAKVYVIFPAGIYTEGYITTAINDGPGCLMLRCPDPSCGAAVGQDMVNVLASHDDMEKYNRYFLRSFIEDNRKVS